MEGALMLSVSSGRMIYPMGMISALQMIYASRMANTMFYRKEIYPFCIFPSKKGILTSEGWL